MQRMFNLDKWDRLEEGSQLAFDSDRPRAVRLEVNAPVKTALHIIDHQGEVRFLALVEGRDTIEFHSEGRFGLTVEGHECLIYTADGADISHTEVAPKIFTKIVERRRRNPELEQIAALMERNMQRRLEQQAHEYEQLLSRRLEASAAQSAAQSVPGNPAPQPAPGAVSGDGEGDPNADGGSADGV